MKKECRCSEYGPTLLRIALGLLFLVPGLGKLADPASFAGWLTALGIPLPMLFAWIVILVEVLGGIGLIVGFGTRYIVWPSIVILLVAAITVNVPALAEDPMAMLSILWHLVGVAGFVSLFLTGPGALSLEKKLMK